MKVLLLFYFLWCINLFAINIDERKIDVYFANGIDTEFDVAQKSAYLIDKAIKKNMPETYAKYLPDTNGKEHEGKIGYAYNNTNGKGLDFLESALVKLGIQDFVDKLFPTDHEKDLEIQIEAYKKNISNGHRVLVIAHSQGNLFTSEAYNALDDWMKEYFEAISVASPRALKIKNNTPHTAWTKDIVPWLGVSFNGIDDPNDDVGVIDAHSFKYYMGYADPTTGLSTSIARNDILVNIDSKLFQLYAQHSQWKVKQTTGCGCDQRVTLTHKEATANLDHLLAGISALSFDVNGKLYQLHDETNTTKFWVKGSAEATAVKDEQARLPNVCYSLIGTDELIKGSANPEPHDGILRVVLDWNKKDIDLNLNVSGPTLGVKEEHPDYECPRENWYIDTQSGLVAGDYFVSIKQTGNVDTSLMPEQIRLDVKAKEKGAYISFDINDTALLNLGDVYKIHLEPLPQGGGFSTTVSNVSKSSARHTDVAYRENDEGTLYTADIFLLLKMISLGPIANASLLLEKFEGGIYKELYTGVTTSGAALNSNGIVLFPSALQESVSIEDIILLTASGGYDVDADDDFNMDETPTPLLGQLHAYMNSSYVTENQFKVNILTEIIYQAVHNGLDANTTKEELDIMLDGVSRLLLKDDLNNDGVITYEDATQWIAGFDKEALQFDYDEKIEPIVQKIYSGEEIYLDVYKLLYAGRIEGIVVDDNVTSGIQLNLNSYADLTLLQKEDFTLKNSSGNNVDFTFSIIEGKVIIEPLDSLIEGQSYTLSFDLEIYDSQDNVYVDTHQHEFVIPDTIPPMIPESTIHVDENYGYISFNIVEPSRPLKYTIDGGVDRDIFDVLNHGSSLFFKVNLDYERPVDSNADNIYELEISVADSFNNVTSQAVRIIIDDVKEGPLLADTNMTVDENMPIGTYVGSMTVVNEGDGNLTGFDAYSEYFRVDNVGNIYTKKVFDFEYPQKYELHVRAYNDVGAWASTKKAYIVINDVKEPLPEVHHFTGSMNDHASEGKVVGQLYVYPGLGGEVEIKLSGMGADDFDINASGHITVSSIADLNHTLKKEYNLKAIANNSYGDSEEANVTIYINVWTKQLGSESNDHSGIVTIDNKGNIYQAGTLNWIPASNKVHKRFLKKYNNTGTLLWSKEFLTLGYIHAISVDDNGTVYLAASEVTERTYERHGYTYNVYAALAMAINADGETIWRKVLDNGAVSTDSVQSIFINTEDEILIAGTTSGAFDGYQNSGKSDLFFAKLSTDGTVQWIKQFGVSAYSVKRNSSGEFYALNRDTLIKLDQSLDNILWSKTFTSNNYDIYDKYYDFVLDSTDNIYILSEQSISYDWEEYGVVYYGHNIDSSITKLNKHSEVLWIKSYGSDKYEFPYAIDINKNDEIYIAGDTRGSLYNNINKAPYLFLNGVGDVFLTKIDIDGNMIETRQYGSIGWDGMSSIDIDSNNDIVMTGGVSEALDGNTFVGKYDMFIMKVPY